MRQYHIHRRLSSLEREYWECAHQPPGLVPQRYLALQVPDILALVDALSPFVRDRLTQILIRQG